ncbi:hypothetical protein BJV77DRAFT_965173 [Russula vinacea]|nr:hypothetical protein BJV77DRAFT_965173 [Russula vinacea]
MAVSLARRVGAGCHVMGKLRMFRATGIDSRTRKGNGEGESTAMMRTSDLGLRLLRPVILGEDSRGNDCGSSEKLRCPQVKYSSDTVGHQIVRLLEREEGEWLRMASTGKALMATYKMSKFLTAATAVEHKNECADDGRAVPIAGGSWSWQACGHPKRPSARQASEEAKHIPEKYPGVWARAANAREGNTGKDVEAELLSGTSLFALAIAYAESWHHHADRVEYRDNGASEPNVPVPTLRASDTTFDNKNGSLNSVVCSNETNSRVAQFPTFSDVPTFPSEARWEVEGGAVNYGHVKECKRK